MKKHPSPRRSPSRCPLRLEWLEDRQLLSATGTGPEPLPAAAGPRYVADKILIQFRSDATEAQKIQSRGHGRAAFQRSLTTADMHAAGRGTLEVDSLAPGQTVDAAIQALKADPAVQFAEPDYIVTTQAISNDPY